MARMPGLLGAGLILGPLVGWGSYRVFRCRIKGWIIYPYLLWLALIATFWMPLSYDYNMVYLPLLIVAVWDKRDPWWAHALLLPAVLWWQPFNLNLPLKADVMNIDKLLTLLGVSVFMMRRVCEAARPTAGLREPADPAASLGAT